MIGAPAPSRSNLLAVTRRLDRVTRASSLLRRKREALVGELFRVARPALDARVQIAEDARRAWEDLLTALAARGEDDLEALARPERSVALDIDTRMVWGVSVPSFGDHPPIVRTLAQRDVAPETVGPAAEQAAAAFEHLVERLVDAAPREILLERLGEHLARTTRQLNVLEQRLAPRLGAERTEIARVLEEREREDHLRLRHLLRTRGEVE